MNKKPVTTIIVDNPTGFEGLPNETANAIQIGNEVLDILPPDSREGVLIAITDGKNKGAVLRVRRAT